MAEDIRAVFPQFHEEHSEQHGLETAAMAEHDLHLERGVVLVAVVGQVSARGIALGHCVQVAKGGIRRPTSVNRRLADL